MTNRNPKSSAKGRGSLWVVLLFVIGLIGAVVGLLLARRSDQSVREPLAESARGLIDKLKKARQSAQTPANLTKVSNWGNYPKPQVRVFEFEDLDTLRQLMTSLDNMIPRGNGRCYGDSSLAPNIISTLRYDKFLSFDKERGVIRCQSGVILSDLLDVVVPQGWFLYVTPGTKQISVGGAVASDVHGKSQHKEGNFCDHVLEMRLMLGDGSVVKCSREENAALYWTTAGGMGLTGVILDVTIALKPVETAYFCQQSIKAENLDELMDLFEESVEWPYSVAWIDCLTKGKSLGRGILMRGEHARLADLETEAQRAAPLVLEPRRKINVPFDFPNFVLNGLTARLFNILYYHKQRHKQVESLVDYNTFFYPLDAITNWNRIYGSRGFTQYQFILPKEKSRQGLRTILEKIAERGLGSFLAVLKLYGHQNGYLPFAMEGYSLALDFPITPNLFEFLEELDQVVLALGGRLYLTKDVRMDRQMFMNSYPTVEDFMENLKTINHSGKFRSFQSDRVGITA